MKILPTQSPTSLCPFPLIGYSASESPLLFRRQLKFSCSHKLLLFPAGILYVYIWMSGLLDGAGLLDVTGSGGNGRSRIRFRCAYERVPLNKKLNC